MKDNDNIKELHPQPPDGLRLSRRDLLKAGALVSAGLVLPGLPETRPRRLPAAPARLPLRQNEQCELPANVIVAENCLPGTTDWIPRNLSESIAGYVHPFSIGRGGTLNIFITCGSRRYSLAIYRMGYYGGTGGRLMLEVGDLRGSSQPGPKVDYVKGLPSCAHWSPSYQLDLPREWLSGVYVIKLKREDNRQEGFAIFVIRDEESRSDLLYQTSQFTFHAYNKYGGKSLYSFNSGVCETVADAPRAVKVSLRRPFHINQYTSNDTFFNVEYPLIRWLEQQGYDVSYSANIDTHYAGMAGKPNHLRNHKVFISSGHDEYWTDEMRNAVTEARDAGVHLSVFSSNTCYWRVRLEKDPWTDEADTVMVCYKTTESGPADPSGHHTGTYRDPQGANNPENALFGVMYIGDNDDFPFWMRVTDKLGKHALFRHTDLQTMPPDTYIQIGEATIGWEWDTIFDNGLTPAGLTALTASPIYGFQLRDAGNTDRGTSGKVTVHSTLYEAPSGAKVFAAGTNQWSWGLGAWAVEVKPVDLYIQQVTYNLFADMGVQPGSPVEEIVLDGEEGMISSPAEAFLPLATPAPVVSDVKLTHLGTGNPLQRGRAIEITWQTDIEALGQIWRGPRPNNTLSVGGLPRGNVAVGSAVNGEDLMEFKTEHRLQIENLTPGTDYYYRVMAYDRNGQVGESEELHFRTPTNPLVTVGIEARETFEDVRCWANTNPRQAQVAAVGGAGATGVGVFGLRTWFVRRRKRRQSQLEAAAIESPAETPAVPVEEAPDAVVERPEGLRNFSLVGELPAVPLVAGEQESQAGESRPALLVEDAPAVDESPPSADKLPNGSDAETTADAPPDSSDADN